MPSALADRRFAELLDRYGPQAGERTVSLAEAEAHCRELAGGHYENFPVLSLALPRHLRQDFANVYAYCRWADDLGDEVRDPAESLRLLDWWRAELDDCYAGRTRHPVFVALRETTGKHAVPKRPFDDLIDAFRQDQTVTRYETFDELRDYCRRSADPVGRIVLHLCGRFDEANAALSDSVCTGLQLINFWQDVSRDLDIGRVYLPREDRERFGYSDEDLAHRRTTPAFVELMRFEVGRARRMLEAGLPLADRMPGRLKAVIALFALGGLRVCDRVEAIGYRVWDERPKLTKADAAKLFAAATARALTSLSRDSPRAHVIEPRPEGALPPVAAKWRRSRRRFTDGPPMTTAARPVSLDASFAHCRRVARRTGRNFYYSFLTLPADQRRDMCALYAYMRVCDDLGDDGDAAIEVRRTALADWRAEVEAALGGAAVAHPVLPALADVVRRRGVPAGPLLDVIAGVEMDLEPVRYETFDDLARYCYHVAGAVGLCCVHVWGFDGGDEARERAVDCGLAFQLTNVLRDLGEDARMGRVYLPAEDLRRFGYGEADLSAGVTDDRFRALMAFEVGRAREFYRRSEPLAGHLSPGGRRVYGAMRRIYGSLLDEIERRDYDVFRERVTLPPWRKLAIAFGAMLRG